MLRLQLHRAHRAVDRGLQLPQGRFNLRAVAPENRGIGFDRLRLADQRQRRRMLATLGLNQAEQVQNLCVIRRLGQQLTVLQLGFFELAATVQRQCCCNSRFS